MILREASTADPGATFTLLCATIQRLKMIVLAENACLKEGVKVHKTYLPRPRPRDTAAAIQTGGITGDVSAMRATPTGTAHDRLKGKANPRHRHAARQKQMGAIGGGEDPVGASVAQDGAQQPTSIESSQDERNRAGYAQRRAHKAQFLKGGDKRHRDDLVGDTVAVNTDLSDRNRLPAHSQNSTAGVNSRYAAAARKSVESERVAGSCGISRDVPRRLGVDGVPSVAAHGAAAECQGLVAAAPRNHAAAAKKTGSKVKDAEMQRVVAVKDAEIERLQRDNAKLQHSERDLKQRLYDEKKTTDGLFAPKLTIKPLGSVQQSTRHRKQQSHIADVLQKRVAAAKAEEATAAEVAEGAAAARAAEETAASTVAEQAAGATAADEATAAEVAEEAAPAGGDSAEIEEAAPAENSAENESATMATAVGANKPTNYGYSRIRTSQVQQVRMSTTMQVAACGYARMRDNMRYKDGDSI